MAGGWVASLFEAIESSERQGSYVIAPARKETAVACGLDPSLRGIGDRLGLRVLGHPHHSLRGEGTAVAVQSQAALGAGQRQLQVLSRSGS